MKRQQTIKMTAAVLALLGKTAKGQAGNGFFACDEFTELNQVQEMPAWWQE